MIIPINEKYRIKSDSRQWMVQELRSVTDKKTKEKSKDFVSFMYFRDLQQAVNGLAQRMIRASDAQTVADALAEVERVSVSLSSALSPMYVVEVR